LPTADWGFIDGRMPIEIEDCGFCRQSQSPIGNLNRQSAIQKSEVAIPQSAID
jgi:hypothetical protein